MYIWHQHSTSAWRNKHASTTHTIETPSITNQTKITTSHTLLSHKEAKHNYTITRFIAYLSTRSVHILQSTTLPINPSINPSQTAQTIHTYTLTQNPPPLCPLCNTQLHATTHLFTCPHVPTQLTALEMWTHPHHTYSGTCQIPWTLLWLVDTDDFCQDFLVILKHSLQNY